MSLKKCLIALIAAVLLFSAEISSAQTQYDPPFQISGIVKSLSENSLEVYLPYINKQITVLVPKDTIIVNRMNSEVGSQSLSAITIDDLVVIKGVLQGESFCSKNISFLPGS